MPVQDEPTGTTPAPADASPSTAPSQPSPNDVSLAAPASAADLLNDSLWDGDKFVGRPEETPAVADAEDAEASDAPAEQPASDDADAAKTPSPEDESKPIDPALVQKLFEENRQLLRLKGKQGSELGAARDRVAELESRLARLEKGEDAASKPEIPQTEEEWDNLFTTSPRRALELWNAEKAKAEAAAQERERYEQQQEVVTVTPEVGAELFIRQNRIESFDKWSESEEGNDVLAVLGSNKQAKYALAAAIQTGDAEAVAEILGDGLRAVRSRAKAKEVVTTARTEITRVEASKPTSVARPGRALNPAPSAPLMQQSAADWLKMSPEEWAKAASGR